MTDRMKPSEMSIFDMGHSNVEAGDKADLEAAEKALSIVNDAITNKKFLSVVSIAETESGGAAINYSTMYFDSPAQAVVVSACILEAAIRASGIELSRLMMDVRQLVENMTKENPDA